MHCAADAGKHTAGNERIAAGGRDDRDDDATENLDLRGAGNQHAEDGGKQRKDKGQHEQRHVQRRDPIANRFFNAERDEDVAYAVSEKHERSGRNDFHQAIGDVFRHVEKRHLLLRLLIGEQDCDNNDQRRDEEKQAVVQRGRSRAETGLEEALVLRGEQERHEHDDREEDGLPAVFQRLSERRDVFLAHRLHLVIPAHEIQRHDALDDEPDRNAPQEQPILRKRVLVRIERIQNSVSRRNHAGRRYHVAHRGAVRFYVRREMRREAGPLHGRDREHTGGGHVAGAGAGQGTHVGRTDDGDKSGAAAKTAENRQDDGDEIIDDRRLGQQMRRDDEHDDHVQA